MISDIREKTSLNQRGATAVEFAVVVTLVLLLIFGILEFGFIFMQKHFISNAAREGVRVGVRANNFNCFDGSGAPPEATCSAATDRREVMESAVRDYLTSLYSEERIETLEITRMPDQNGPASEKTLSVAVSVRNLMPPLASALVPGMESPDRIFHTATGGYEDPEEP